MPQLLALLTLAILQSPELAYGIKSLSLSISGPASVTDISDLNITATLRNSGTEGLVLIRDPQGVLDPFETDSFNIVNDKGTSPEFIGAYIKYSPRRAVEGGAVEEGVSLAPGQGISVVHHLASAYSFAESGSGSYTIEPNTKFLYFDPVRKMAMAIQATPAPDEFAELTAEGHEKFKFIISGRLESSINTLKEEDERDLVKRARFRRCSPRRQVILNSASAAAERYVNTAFIYLTNTTRAKQRYTTWFGSFTLKRRNAVLRHFGSMQESGFTNFLYDCSCKRRGVLAYVYPNRFGRIYLCPAFWHAPATGTESRAGVLVRESSHFNRHGRARDYVRGQSACKHLASEYPETAAQNADNHEYFAENSPSLA